MRTFASLSFALLLALCLAAPAVANGKAGPTTPGKYTDWRGEIDELEVVSPFKLADFTRIVVEPFDVSATPLPEASDNTFEPVKKVLAGIAPPFVEGLHGELSKLPVSLAKEGESAAPQELRIRGKVLVMDPGSQAARYWGGFGAGAARTQILGEVVDGGSGQVLLRFSQERRSGFGAFGGDYEKLMKRNLRQIGGDVSGLLKAF
jgi:Domain of unknown function (DUF4410)